ncbi:uncharacterized protein [Rhodnius prolixus]|uniref:uncharacterized protein n=1 Tax=Rhodnius prolixus TaxID=13249 RepID=UPI003D18EAF7
MNRNEQKPIILFQTFLCSLVKTLIVVTTATVCSLYTYDHFITTKGTTEFLLTLTAASYTIIITLSLITWIFNEPLYDISVITFHFLYGTLAHVCAVLLKTEPTSSANYVREFSFALLGLLSYIYAGFFLLYPKLMPLKEIKTEKVPEKEVSKVEEEQLDEEPLFIYIPLKKPSQNTMNSSKSLDVEAQRTSTSPPAVPGTSSQ